MKKIILILAVILLFQLPSLLDISIIGAGSKKTTDADHPLIEQSASAAKEEAFDPITAASSDVQKTACPDESIKSSTTNTPVPTVASDQKTVFTDQTGTAKTKETPKTSDPGKTPLPKTKATEDPPTTEADASSRRVTLPEQSHEEKPNQPSKSEQSGKATNLENQSQEPANKVESPSSQPKGSASKVRPSDTTKVTEDTKVSTPATEVNSVPVKCSHNWVWKTHTETKTIPAKTHEVPVYDDGWDEGVTVQKVYCSECEKTYDTSEDYYAYDKCHGSSGLITVIDHYIHHEPELLFIDTIVDEPERKETVTVNDYQYCSICGEHK